MINIPKPVVIFPKETKDSDKCCYNDHILITNLANSLLVVKSELEINTEIKQTNVSNS